MKQVAARLHCVHAVYYNHNVSTETARAVNEWCTNQVALRQLPEQANGLYSGLFSVAAMFSKDDIIDSAALQVSYHMTASNHLQLAGIVAHRISSLCHKVLCNVEVGLVRRPDKGSKSLVGIMELPTSDPRFDGD